MRWPEIAHTGPIRHGKPPREYRHRRGHPVGFSAEFYSELIRLQRERDLQRLLAQYPAHGVEVDDAGILMTQDPHSSLAPLRTVLQGHAGLHAQH